MTPINPKEIRYIKLGTGGKWAQLGFERGEIHFGYKTVPHDLCLSGDWDAVVRLLVDEGRSMAKARDATREIRDFYTLGPDCLWITVADGHLWWALADPANVHRSRIGRRAREGSRPGDRPDLGGAAQANRRLPRAIGTRGPSAPSQSARAPVRSGSARRARPR